MHTPVPFAKATFFGFSVQRIRQQLDEAGDFAEEILDEAKYGRAVPSH
jgi:hypothetical protein